MREVWLHAWAIGISPFRPTSGYPQVTHTGEQSLSQWGPCSVASLLRCWESTSVPPASNWWSWGATKRAVWSWSVAPSSCSNVAGSPMATSKNSTRSPMRCAGSSKRAERRRKTSPWHSPPPPSSPKKSHSPTKRTPLPGGMTEQELEIQVESEANQYIPFSLDEVSLDFCVVGPSKTAADDV